MDFSRFKEEFSNLCKNSYNTIINSSFFYFIKDKYDGLSSLHRRIIYSFSILILSSLILYFPLSHLYSSWKNMSDFNTKKKLINEMIILSSTKDIQSSKSYQPNQNPVQFIERRIPTLGINNTMVKGVKKAKFVPPLKNLPFSAKVETVKVQLENLNLKEVIQYGHQMEQFSNNIKLTNIEITENPEKENYFHVSYFLSFFLFKEEVPKKENTNLKKRSSTKTHTPDTSSKKIKQKNTEKKPTANERIFDKLKIAPAPSISPQKAEKIKDKKVPLLDIKKEGLMDKESHFKNRPLEVKKRDLIPALPVKEKKNTDEWKMPDPPKIEPPPVPEIKNTIEKEE